MLKISIIRTLVNFKGMIFLIWLFFHMVFVIIVLSPSPKCARRPHISLLAITNIEVGPSSTNTIRNLFFCGVKQNCPLSPLLLDLVVDELLKRLQSRAIGVQVGGEQIAVMTFDDDLVLVTEEALHMDIAL